MYKGRAGLLKKKDQDQSKAKYGKEIMIQKAERLKNIFTEFQNNIGSFTEKYRDQINTNPKFRDRFNMMCQELGRFVKSAKKNMWTGLGFGDFYHYLAMKILDICAKKRHQNGGLMKIVNVIEEYNKQFKDSISKNDIVRALDQTAMLGNLSIINGEYVCTVPLQMSEGLPQLMEIAEKFGFISAKLLSKLKGWESNDFYIRIQQLRKGGLLWVDKKTKAEPHYYFATHISDFDIAKFLQFINSY